MNKKPSLHDLGLDTPSSKPKHADNSAPKVADEVDHNDFKNTIRCFHCSQLIHRDSAACAFCKTPVANPLAIENKPVKRSPASKICQFCNSSISSLATKCPQCHEWLTAEDIRWNGTAAVLSFFAPGAGQIYKGNLGRGLLFLFLAIIGYALFVIPGLIAHVLIISDAGQQKRWIA